MFGFNRQAISMGEIYRLTRDKSRLPLAVMRSGAMVAGVELPLAALPYRMSPMEGV
jgi:hypothetical protein